MTYSVKLIVYATDDPRVESSVRAALEAPGATIQEFGTRKTGDGENELYAEIRLSDRRHLDQILRGVEAVKGAAVMAATTPKEIRPAGRGGGSTLSTDRKSG
jgi:hypothetical protein